jgi:hypothetical protein
MNGASAGVASLRMNGIIVAAQPGIAFTQTPFANRSVTRHHRRYIARDDPINPAPTIAIRCGSPIGIFTLLLTKYKKCQQSVCSGRSRRVNLCHWARQAKWITQDY